MAELTEEKQLENVRMDARYIRQIVHPSENVQLAAVKNAWYAVKYIENPTEQVQIIADSHDVKAINFIKHPTENVQRHSNNLTKNFKAIEILFKKLEMTARIESWYKM